MRLLEKQTAEMEAPNLFQIADEERESNRSSSKSSSSSSDSKEVLDVPLTSPDKKKQRPRRFSSFISNYSSAIKEKERSPDKRSPEVYRRQETNGSIKSNLRRGYSATGKHLIDTSNLNKIRDTFTDVMNSNQFSKLKLVELKYAENKTKSETMIAID